MFRVTVKWAARRLRRVIDALVPRAPYFEIAALLNPGTAASPRA
jgi:hypothetical protein